MSTDDLRTHCLRITATLILDEFPWARNDIATQEWMLNQIVLGDDLRVVSPEIGDVIGVLLVHSAGSPTECDCRGEKNRD